VQTAVEEPTHSSAAGTVVVVDTRQFSGVGPEQVVEGVPAGAVFGEQVPAAQFGQQRADPVRRDTGEAGSGADGDVWAGM
jgi:hypothetical protein